MEQVQVRISAPDEQAVKQVRSVIAACIKGCEFDRIKIGRDGDWLCYGLIDEDALPVDVTVQELLTWAAQYVRMRAVLVNVLSENDTLVNTFDYAIDLLRKQITTSSRQKRRRY